MLKNTICQLYMYHTIAICLFYKTLQVLKYTTYNVLEKDHFKINQVLNMQNFEKGHLSFRRSKKIFFVFHGGWKP